MNSAPDGLCVEKVHVWRGDRHVLRGVSLDVHAGELMHVSGPNGTGKTTLLRVLGGLTPAAWILAAALFCRFALQAELHRLFRLRNGIFWLGPIRDILSFVVFVASFFGRRVEWRGHRYAVKADHTLAYSSEADS